MAWYDASRNTRPASKEHLDCWLRNYTGVRLARKGVCEGHHAQLDVLWHLWSEQPPDALLLGSRGSGKSYLASIKAHMRSRFFANHGSRVLGGAKSQAQQVLQGFKEAVLTGGSTIRHGGVEYNLNDRDTIARSAVEFISYRNGSEIKILTASPTSVRGPHIPDLYLDEVDEIESELRNAAYGMVMQKGKDKSIKPTILKTSTWHNLGGEMETLIRQAEEMNREKPGSYPFFKFCLFDVLERCPEEISGPNLENCHSCPLMPYCHADKDRHGGVPKAKRSDGHYTIGAAIQKMQGVPQRVFEADYLCLGPKADDIWFSRFDQKRNVSDAAEYKPHLPVHVALDTGLHTAAVFFQVEQTWIGGAPDWQVTVFADYYLVDQIPEVHVKALKDIAQRLCQGKMDKRWTDPAGRQRNAIGSVALGEYAMAGMTFTCWPASHPKDGLTMMEGLVVDATGKARLLIHPRCRGLINAFRTYRRDRVGGQLADIPLDPQHDSEDFMDALRGGLTGIWPEGRLPQPNFSRKHASQVF